MENVQHGTNKIKLNINLSNKTKASGGCRVVKALEL
jgi:hypothetical protein